MASIPRPIVAKRETRISSFSVACSLADHARVDVMRDRRSTGQSQTRDDGQNGGEGHCRQEAEQHVATDRFGQVHGDHVATADDLASDDPPFEELGVLTDDNDCAEAHQEDHVEEEAGKTGSIEYRFARFLGVADGEEAHQDMRQPGGAEHQTKAERYCRDRISEQTSRRHQLRDQAYAAPRPG
jgi:hypothetical protein